MSKRGENMRIISNHNCNTLAQDIYDCLCNQPRWFPPKYFYDEHGSRLFNQICNASEYYLTRIEEHLLECHIDEIIASTKPSHIIEFGSGFSRKTRLILDSCEKHNIKCIYWPLDICEEALELTSHKLKTEYSWLEVCPLCGDYNAISAVNLPEGRKLVLFLGSTIGNLQTNERLELLINIRDFLDEDGKLLLGMDRTKNKDVLEAAYNDKQGLTAQFNLNLLNVLNKELGGNFSLDNFSHYAFYDIEKEQIEMHIVSRIAQQIYLKELDLHIKLEQDESVLTEISRKFSVDTIYRMAKESAYYIEQHFTPENNYFSLLLMKR